MIKKLALAGVIGFAAYKDPAGAQKVLAGAEALANPVTHTIKAVTNSQPSNTDNIADEMNGAEYDYINANKAKNTPVQATAAQATPAAPAPVAVQQQVQATVTYAPPSPPPVVIVTQSAPVYYAPPPAYAAYGPGPGLFLVNHLINRMVFGGYDRSPAFDRGNVFQPRGNDFQGNSGFRPMGFRPGRNN
jgi:hypothetical protein